LGNNLRPTEKIKFGREYLLALSYGQIELISEIKIHLQELDKYPDFAGLLY